MAHIRGPDGRPIDDDESEAATRRVSGKRPTRDRARSAPTSDPDAPTGGRGGGASAGEDATVGRRGDDDRDTDRVGESRGSSGGDPVSRQTAQTDVGDDRTRLVGARGRQSASRRPAETAPRGGATAADPMDDPVVGWLVVVDGPGKGASVSLGYGMNSIGRAPTERVSIDFGDDEISRSQHALLTYDPKGRKFFIQHGGGRNLTYLGTNNQPVLSPIELKGGEEISIGSTKLRFVAFCGSDFDWDDL